MFNFLSCPFRHKRLGSLFPILLCNGLFGFAQEQSAPVKDNTILQTDDLSLDIQVTDHHFGGLRVHDGFSNRTIDLPESFVLVLKDKSVLRSTEMQVTKASDSILAADPHRSLRISHEGGASSSACWNFATPRLPASMVRCRKYGTSLRPTDNQYRRHQSGFAHRGGEVASLRRSNCARGRHSQRLPCG